MGAAEGVVYVEVAERGELGGELGIIGLLLGMEAQVLQQQGLAGLELARHLQRDVADAVRRKCDVLREIEDLFEQQAQTRHQWAQTHRLHWLALGPAEVRAQDDLGLVAKSVLQGGKGLADAGVIGDEAVLQGDVEVDADEHALVGQIQVTNRKLRHRNRISRFACRGNTIVVSFHGSAETEVRSGA